MDENCATIKAAIINGSPIQPERWTCTPAQLTTIEAACVTDGTFKAPLVKANLQLMRASVGPEPPPATPKQTKNKK